MKKIILPIFTVLCVIFLLSMPYHQSQALTLNEIFVGGNKFIEDASNKQLFNEDNEQEAVTTLYWIGLAVAVGLAIIIGMVLGIQFITSGVSGQAKVKEKLIPYAIGVVVALGAYGLWGIAVGIAKNTF